MLSPSIPETRADVSYPSRQLVAGMGPRAAKSGKFMPAGLVATLGALSTLYQVRWMEVIFLVWRFLVRDDFC